MKSLTSNKQSSPKVADSQQGVTLIEALVTLLVLAVGALGIASMQLAGLKYASGSYGRTQAVILADDMANRLKSNRAFALNLDEGGALILDANNVAVGSPYELAGFDSPTPAATADCLDVAVTCSSQELTNYDLLTWRNELARVLPSGRGMITTIDRVVPGRNGEDITQRQFNIAIEWRQVSSSTSDTSVATAANFDPDDELQNFTFRILL